MPAASFHHNGFVGVPESQGGVAPGRPGFLVRLLQRYHGYRLRRAEGEVARFIQNRGGRVTDAVERQIERHFV